MTTRLVALVGVAAVAGCDVYRVQLPTTDADGEPAAVGGRFDPATTGTITGAVTWGGDRPAVPAMRVCRFTKAGPQWLDVPNPRAPGIGPGGELAGAVVFLRGIDPGAAGPVAFPPVVVEADDDALTIRPGGGVGFVRCGAEVEFRSASDALVGVRARGAAFFTHLLPDRGSVKRRLDRPGRVELTSPAYLYWQVADLFVCEHPYYTRTDEHGRFRFEGVPAGEYQVVCWLPHWEIDSTERDPESGAVFRAAYRRAGEESVPVRVEPGRE
jgi:hypothetical protein